MSSPSRSVVPIRPGIGDTVNEIQRIISQLEQQRSAIDTAISALREVTGTSSQSAASQSGPSQSEPTPTGRPRRRRLSAKGRRRISEAAKKMWATKKTTGPATGQSRRKGGLTPAGRKRLAEAMKLRWAQKRAGQTEKKATATKKSSSKKVAAKSASSGG